MSTALDTLTYASPSACNTPAQFWPVEIFLSFQNPNSSVTSPFNSLMNRKHLYSDHIVYVLHVSAVVLMCTCQLIVLY